MFRHYTRCLRQLGRNEEAIDFLNKIIETKPDATRYLASLHMSRAWCHAGNEDWVAAKFDCTRALVLCRQSEYHSSKHEEIAADFASASSRFAAEIGDKPNSIGAMAGTLAAS